MPLLDIIKEPINREMAHYDSFMRRSLHSDHHMTQTMLTYILSSRGKAVRPMITLLVASMFNSSNKELPSDSLLSAMLVEMMHTASLVHDDVIDEAYIRRGQPSAKALWRSRRAVLIGDYILAKSYLVGMQSGSYKLVAYIVEAMNDLCEGELKQSDQSDKLEMNREIYNDIIYKKTASLIGTSSGVGAMSVGAKEEDVVRMREFGDSLGMAFQIKDDILDYTLTAKTGKPTCGDLRERKITLPLLAVMERSSESERRNIVAKLSDIRTNTVNAEYLHALVLSHGGLDIATEVMQSYIARSKQIIGDYPESQYRASLSQLCDYVASRNM